MSRKMGAGGPVDGEESWELEKRWNGLFVL